MGGNPGHTAPPPSPFPLPRRSPGVPEARQAEMGSVERVKDTPDDVLPAGEEGVGPAWESMVETGKSIKDDLIERRGSFLINRCVLPVIYFVGF